MEYTYSPHDLLPIKNPLDENPDKMFFYNNVVKHLIPDILRIMDNGTPIDLDKVNILETKVKETLLSNAITLDNNSYMKKFLIHRYNLNKQEVLDEIKSKYRTVEFYADITYQWSSKVHRTYLMNCFLSDHNLEQYHTDSWGVKDVKNFITIDEEHKDFYLNIINKQNTVEIIKYQQQALKQLAKEKTDIYNKNRDKVLETFEKNYIPTFNTNSSLQKNQLFKFYGIETMNLTPTGAMQIDRDELERLYLQVSLELENIENLSEEDIDYFTNIKEILEAFITDSNANIINNNFIPAFKAYTINNVLYGNQNLFGTKTFRLTANNPNLLALPSHGNIFAKDVKECFVAPEGYIVYAVDLSALEDRVIANLSQDENKCAVFTEGIDSHCLNSIYYVREDLRKIFPFNKNESEKEYAKRMIQEIDNGNIQLKNIRQKYKSSTFLLNYGGGAEKLALSIGATLEQGEDIYNAYHFELYAGISEFRDKVINRVKETGRIHLGLGCYMHSTNPKEHKRTLFNACSQFWSIITLLAINKIHQLIDKNNFSNKIYITNTIYDSIYFIVKKDAILIKWLNDAIIPLLTVDFIENQIVKNEAQGEIGFNWANLTSISNNASLEEIQTVLQELERV